MTPKRDVRARARVAAGERRRTVAAVAALALVAAVTVAVFAKDNPLASPKQVKVAFESAVALRDGSAVRVAGIDVGSVTAIDAGPGGTAVVTIELADSAPSLHRDAQFSIEPRLALEGNFYVKVAPGSPTQPELGSGATVPVAQTDAPVQIDQALGTFPAAVREQLANSFGELAKGFGKGADGNESGARSLAQAVTQLDAGLDDVATVSSALRGRRRGDLSRAIGSTGEVVEQLAADPRRLADFMTDYAQVSATLARRDVDLGRSIEGFDRTFALAPRVLPKVDGALDELATFSPQLRRALIDAPPALTATRGLLDQVEAAVRPGELGTLLTRLRPTTAALPEFLRRFEGLSPPVAELSRCLNHPVLPALKMVVPDGTLTTNDPAWLELLHLGGSAGGSSGGFDGNGSALRLGLTFGEQNWTGNIPNLGKLEGLVPANSSMNPEWLGFGHFPPSRPGNNCADQKLPDLSVRGGKRPFDWLTPADTPPPAIAGSER